MNASNLRRREAYIALGRSVSSGDIPATLLNVLEASDHPLTERVRRCMLALYVDGISTWLQRLDRFAQVVERTKGAPNA